MTNCPKCGKQVDPTKNYKLTIGPVQTDEAKRNHFRYVSGLRSGANSKFAEIQINFLHKLFFVKSKLVDKISRFFELFASSQGNKEKLHFKTIYD